MQDDVPTTALNAIDDAIEDGHVRCAAEMFDEVETNPADATPIERIKIFIGEAIVYNGDATIAFRVGRNAIEHGGIVGSVATRLHDHRTLDTQMRMQSGQHLLRRVGRCVASVGRVRKPRSGSKDVAMGVTGPGRQA